MTDLVYVAVKGTNVHTAIGHGQVTQVLHRGGAVSGVIVRLDEGGTAYITTGARTGERDGWAFIDHVRRITRDEFDDLTGLTDARREMGWTE